mmetsp:Transcript_43173/g.101483  ORF Transcript_43173/g.101483 Transcript_43173/m.101483 type:complete len:205 (+) Transcript_43173:497-1111(+)
MTSSASPSSLDESPKEISISSSRTPTSSLLPSSISSTGGADSPLLISDFSSSSSRSIDVTFEAALMRDCLEHVLPKSGSSFLTVSSFSFLSTCSSAASSSLASLPKPFASSSSSSSSSSISSFTMSFASESSPSSSSSSSFAVFSFLLSGSPPSSCLRTRLVEGPAASSASAASRSGFLSLRKSMTLFKLLMVDERVKASSVKH